MKKKGRFLLTGIIMIVSVTLVSSWSLAGEVAGVTENTIKVGGIWDHTGPVATIIAPIIEGIKNYGRYVNDQGGINGRQIKLIIEDDRYSIPMAVAAFKKLVYRDKVFALLGPGSTGETRVLMRHIMSQKLPCFPLAADRDMVDPYKKYIFLAIDTYDHQTGVLFDWIVQDSKPKKPKVACMVLDIGAKVPFLRAVNKWSKHFGLDPQIVMTTLGAVDFTPEILTLKRKKPYPDYVITFLTIPGIVGFIRDSKKLGFHPKVLATYSGTSEDVVNSAKKAADKFYGVHFYSSWYDDTPGMAELRKITLQYHPGTEKPYRGKNYCIGWVKSKLLYEGIKRAGRDLDNEKLIDALETLRNFDTKGICGPITYTSKDHAGIKYDKIYKGDPATGKLIPITDWRKAPDIK